jgi:hypothetical protein
LSASYGREGVGSRVHGSGGHASPSASLARSQGRVGSGDVPRCILRDLVGLAAASCLPTLEFVHGSLFSGSCLTTLPPRPVQCSGSREIRCSRRLFHVSPRAHGLAVRGVVRGELSAEAIDPWIQ